jgi:ADP-heptose:LPS heptosyltransferase
MKCKNGLVVMSYKETFTLPFDFEIPSSSQELVKNKSSKSPRLKYVKRFLYLTIKRQKLLEISSISSNHFNILWVNISAPSLGDSLMDLSSRIMLNGRKVDLFTDKKNAHIYEADKYFNSIFTDESDLKEKSYDLVIIDSYSTRSIKCKFQIAPLTPYIGMFGFFNGPEVNRVLFSFYRMNKLLGYKKNDGEIRKTAKPSIFISSDDKDLIEKLKLPKNFIAIAVGGEWSYRTFNSWPVVIKKLIQLDNKLKIILIGSRNGHDHANEIMRIFSNENVLNYVSQFTFNQTAELISRARYCICCDGGLMHASNSVGATTVTLLARLNRRMQLTDANNSFSIYDGSNVNNISINNIINLCKEASIFVDSHPQNE